MTNRDRLFYAGVVIVLALSIWMMSGALAGEALLSWTAPTERTDGSPVELGGFEIYHGETEGGLTLHVQLLDPNVAQYRFDGLPTGQHFFAVKAVDTNGLTSALSNVASKTITADPNAPVLDGGPSVELNYTSTGGSLYYVRSDGAVLSSHSTLHKALQTAHQHKAQNLESDVAVTQDLEIRVEKK